MPKPQAREESPVPRAWRKVAATPEPQQEEPLFEPARVPTLNNVTATPELDQHPQRAAAAAPAPVQPNLSNLPTEDSSDWPPHMVAAHCYFTKEAPLIDNGLSDARNWGDEWLACVRAYIECQRRAGFPDTGPSFPPAKNIRPPEIAAWMKN